MARFVRGDVVVVPFPFSDAGGAKRRPALVLAELPFAGGTDYLVCLITSRTPGDPHSLTLAASDIVGGALPVQSYVRPLYLFAAEDSVIVRRVGTLQASVLAAVVRTITDALA